VGEAEGRPLDEGDEIGRRKKMPDRIECPIHTLKYVI
jgi:hypothetical protein